MVIVFELLLLYVFAMYSNTSKIMITKFEIHVLLKRGNRKIEQVTQKIPGKGKGKNTVLIFHWRPLSVWRPLCVCVCSCVCVFVCAACAWMCVCDTR